MDAGRRRKTPMAEKETLLFISLVEAKIPAFFHWFPKSKILQGDRERARRCLHLQWVELQERNLSSGTSILGINLPDFYLKEITFSILSRPEEESISSKAVSYTNIFEKIVQNNKQSPHS